MNKVTSVKYSRPPVLEAVIGITFARPIADATLATIDRRLGKNYPIHTDNQLVNLHMSTSMGANNRPVVDAKEHTVCGHRRTNQSMDEIAVLMPDSLTVSQLAPYSGWESFFDRFKRDFTALKRPNTSRSISRVGMRYINRVDIPASGNVVEHEQFVDMYPHVPEALGPMVGFSMQAQFALESISGHTIINSMPVQSVKLGHASFLVDIDVYRTVSTPMNDDSLFALLVQMRIEKNRIFEACVTQRAREELFGYAKH